ncbi:MAG TPA: inositol monophosphatase [Devosia sp.]|jgi:myo-inositol-1(or 4)-monophosphatase|uniref:inositol monophosphatase family protein n=1 Tax=Devosia sp. TaxID=1871048 RepID=UPI002DDD902A|nr:inositol monophosphatase [Devosia sp.]HEV2516425.1 inositol monophosphatase [Devosia sp.]
MSLERRLVVAGGLVAAAGELARRAHADDGLEITSKGPGDLVSETDFAIERMMRDAIGAEFPDDGIIGEEFGGAHRVSGFTWLIDPIDGTVNFARRLGYFCISLALLEDGRPVAAFILDPLRNELFHAGPDRVARLNGKPIRCAMEADFGEAVIGLGFSTRHDPALNGQIVDGLTKAGTEHRRLGAGALCLAHVAAGRLNAYVEPHMNPWDAVGGLYLAACSGAVTGNYIAVGGLTHGAPVYAAAPPISPSLLAVLPALISGTPLHRENEPRSAGEVASSSHA